MSGRPAPSAPEGTRVSADACCSFRRGLHGQHRPAEGRRPHRARPARVSLEAGSCGKTPEDSGLAPALPLLPRHSPPPSLAWPPPGLAASLCPQQYYEDGARIEAAFRNYIHRADVKQQEDSYEIFICHANVIRYIVCR